MIAFMKKYVCYWSASYFLYRVNLYYRPTYVKLYISRFIICLFQLDMEESINSAIKRGFLQQVRFLIEYGHSVNERDDAQRTPLINCALIADEQWGAGLARLLVEKGARVSLRDRRGLTALHYACVYNRALIVDVYLNALDFEFTLLDKFGNTALHYAAAIGSLQLCRMLINVYRRYQEDCDVTNKRRETPLMMAWKGGHLECGALILDECRARTDIRDIDGVSAKQWLNAALSHHSALADMRRQREQNNRPRTASARLERLATPKPLPNQRPVSANMLHMRPRRQTYSFRQKESLSHDPVQIVRSGQLYKPASQSDLRNKPEYVFQLSAADCFVNQARYPMSDISSSCSHSTLNQLSQQTTSHDDPVNSSWREAIKSYFTTYDYQFSHAFCRGAVAPEPEPEVPLEERVVSPTPTHASAEPTESEFGSASSVVRKSPKKIVNALSALKGFSDGGEKRKTSRQEKPALPVRKISALKPTAART